MEEEEQFNANNALQDFLSVLHNGGSYFGGGSIFTDLEDSKEEKPKYEQLGDGFELRPIDDGGYSHLYKDDKKITSLIFRKGGMCGGFKDGYCSLILYAKKRKTKKDPSKYTCGEHVLINTCGEIVLENRNSLDDPYHIGGNVGSIKNNYYDLRTGEVIFTCSNSGIRGENYIILEHRFSYDHYDVQKEPGIYKIDKETCKITKIDNIK